MKKILLFSILLAIVCSIACNKSDKTEPAKPDPIDSTSAALSPNCIDSVAGVYYGHATTWVKTWTSGTSVMSNVYDGPDTILVSKLNDSVMNFHSNHCIALGSYQFDSSDIIRTGYNGTVYLFPKTDSLSHEFNLQAGDIQNGTTVYSRFQGTK